MSSPSTSMRNLAHRYTGTSVRVGRGTLFFTGGTVRRYATIALTSDSFIVEKEGQSIGNGSMREPSLRVPFVITRLISSSVQLPSPVSLSDVRLPVVQVPHGARS